MILWQKRAVIIVDIVYIAGAMIKFNVCDLITSRYVLTNVFPSFIQFWFPSNRLPQNALPQRSLNSIHPPSRILCDCLCMVVIQHWFTHEIPFFYWFSWTFQFFSIFSLGTNSKLQNHSQQTHLDFLTWCPSPFFSSNG